LKIATVQVAINNAIKVSDKSIPGSSPVFFNLLQLARKNGLFVCPLCRFSTATHNMGLRYWLLALLLPVVA